MNDREATKKINQITRSSPFYEKFSQPRYKHLKGYPDHDQITFDLARMLTSYQFYDPSFFDADFTHKSSLINVHQAYLQGFSSYWLNSQLFDAFCNTKLPKSIGHLKRVIPIGLLLFPSRLKNPDGQYLKWLLFSHRLADEAIAPINLLKSRMEVVSQLEDNLTWCTMLDNGVQYAVNRSLKLEGDRLNYETDEMYINDLIQQYGSNIDTITEKEFTDKVTELLIQVLLYLQLEPNTNLVSVSSSDRSINGQNKKQKLNPHIIGENYQTKIEKNPSKITDVKHKSPITHWRMGRYRMQPYGEKDNTQHKLIWIEPMLINS